MSKNKLIAAKEFIEAKQYDVARNILEAMPEDVTAQRWLAKLNELFPKPKSLEELTDEELIASLDKREAAIELIRRSFDSVHDYWEEMDEQKGNEARYRLTALTNHLCTTIEAQKNLTYLEDVLMFILQNIPSAFELPGPPELEILSKLALHENITIRNTALAILTKLNSTRANLILYPLRFPGFNVTWSAPNGPKPFRETDPIIKVNNKGVTVFSVYIRKSRPLSNLGRTVYSLEFSPEIHLNQYSEMIPPILKAAMDIKSQFLITMKQRIEQTSTDDEFDEMVDESEGVNDFDDFDDDYDDLDDFDDDYDDLDEDEEYEGWEKEDGAFDIPGREEWKIRSEEEWDIIDGPFGGDIDAYESWLEDD